MHKKTLLQLGIILATSLNYAGTTLLNLIWAWEIHLFLPILVVTSCLMGVTVVDMKRAVIYASISVFLGSTLVTVIMATPPMLLGEAPVRVDAAIMTALTAASKYLVLTVVLCISGAMMGSFVGDWLESIEEYEI